MGDPTTQAGQELPPLPEPHWRQEPSFSAIDMQAYARAALAQRDAAAVPVAWARETAGGLHVCYMQEEPPVDPPWGRQRSDARWIPLYTHPSPQGDKP